MDGAETATAALPPWPHLERRRSSDEDSRRLRLSPESSSLPGLLPLRAKAAAITPLQQPDLLMPSNGPRCEYAMMLCLTQTRSATGRGCGKLRKGCAKLWHPNEASDPALTAYPVRLKMA